MMKKLLSLLVVLCTVCSVACLPTFAEGADTLLFEFENGTYTGASFSKGDAPDGSKFLYSYGNTAREDVEITGSVNIPTSGYYKVTYVIGHKTGTNSTARKKVSTLYLTMDGYTFLNYSRDDHEEQPTGYPNITSEFVMSRYETTKWFDAGELPITLKVWATSDGNKYMRFAADYVKFEPLTNPIFDFYDYKPSAAKGTRKNNNKYMYIAADSTTPEDINIPIKITEDGNYKVTYIVSNATSAESQINLNLIPAEGESIPIGDNTKTGETTGSSYHTTYGIVYKYEAELENIQVGDYTIQAEIVNNSSNQLVCYMDNIEIALLGEENTNTLTKEDNTVTATVYYDEEVNGTPILALYNGQELVIAGIGDVVENATNITVSVSTSEAFDRAKVFVWDDTVSMIPQIGSVPLSIS